MSTKTVLVFGNPDLKIDSLPLKILPKLKGEFPACEFLVLDPNEDWDISGDVVVLDTVIGIEKVAVFDDLEKFQDAPRVSMHDFDALTNLRFMQKLNKVKKVSIIGIPPEISEREAIDGILRTGVLIK